MTCLLSTNYQSYNTVIKQWTVFSISKFYLYPVKMERKSLNTPKFTILLSNSQTIDKESDKIKTSVSIFIPYIFCFCSTDHERERRGHLRRWGPVQAPSGRGSCCEAWQHGSNHHTMNTQTFWPWTSSQTPEWWKTVRNDHKSSDHTSYNIILFYF